MTIEPFTNDRRDYACQPKPLGEGGFARAFAATHKPSGEQVVLKSLKRSVTEEASQRMRREVDVMRSLAGHPHVMPILAADPQNEWYVMPRADGSLKQLAGGLDTDENRAKAVLAAADGLRAAHDKGVVHRDVTPGNILRLPCGTWVLADFGLVRRPPGQTTHPWTQHGVMLGTYGYVAPELRTDAHAAATAASDVYSLARVLEFCLTGSDPQPGSVDPGAGPFRRAIRNAIREVASTRSALERFVKEIEAALSPLPTLGPSVHELSEAAQSGDHSSARQLLRLAFDRQDDGDLYLDEITKIDHQALLAKLCDLESDEFRAIVTAMARHMKKNFGSRRFEILPSMVFWLQRAAEAARLTGDPRLFEDVAEIFLTVDARLDRWKQRPRSLNWLQGLRSDDASIVARLIRDHPEVSAYYGDATSPTEMDPSIAAVLRAGSRAS